MEFDKLNENTVKYKGCNYKSTELHKKVIQRCSCQGGNQTVEGYFCEKREIFKVTPEICEACPVYETR